MVESRDIWHTTTYRQKQFQQQLSWLPALL